MPAGRPSKYSKEQATYICAELANGRSLREICEEEQTPSRESVRRWLDEHEEFRGQYARAREEQAEYYAQQIIDIADTPLMGKKTKTTSKGEVEVTEGDMIEHRRLQVDSRKWIACKLLPKVYGDRQQVDVTGTVNVNIDLGDD